MPGDDAATFLFADIAGFTALTEAHGDEHAVALVEQFADAVRKELPPIDGEYVKSVGDALMVRVPDPADAIRLGLTITHGLFRGHEAPAVRVGLNHGPAVERDGDYFGSTVNIAARIASQAGPDQVFVGEDVLPHITPSGFRLVEVGAFELKGIAKPLMLYEAKRDDS